MELAKSVLLVSDEAIATEGLKKGLLQSGVTEIFEYSIEQNFLTKLNDLNVDFIVLDIEKPNKELFERISVVDSLCPTPVICFSNDSDSSVIANSVKAGISAYIVDGKSPERIKPIMEVAYQRFKACQAMRKELTIVKDKLSERATIEKAKGILVQEKGLTEDQAYSTMRKMAMDQGRRISTIAHEICGVFLGVPDEQQQA